MRVITVLILALFFIAGANTATFQPGPTVGKDAHVDKAFPSSNYGADFYLYFSDAYDEEFISFIEFRGLDDAQYQGATVSAATLYLYMFQYCDYDQFDHNIGPCDASWEEMSVSWNNRPGVYESYSIPSPSETGWKAYDVTDWVQNWLDGTWVNNGFSFFSSRGFYATFRSSDYTDDSTLRPKLVLEYYGAAVEEATWGEIKATF